jgi:hypothetical protein
MKCGERFFYQKRLPVSHRVQADLQGIDRRYHDHHDVYGRIIDQITRLPIHADGIHPREIEFLLRVPSTDGHEPAGGKILNDVSGIADAVASCADQSDPDGASRWHQSPFSSHCMKDAPPGQ